MPDDSAFRFLVLSLDFMHTFVNGIFLLFLHAIVSSKEYPSSCFATCGVFATTTEFDYNSLPASALRQMLTSDWA
ncbi:hypothetical protein V1282_000055 [Nitrobacteraceae bacterium AZCC 2146]